MTQDIMSEYRAKKLEEEFFARGTFPRPCELVLKHGKSRDVYWGKPEVIAESSKEVDGERMNLVSVLWKTKRDKPVAISLVMPMGMKLESLMVPCKYMETDRGYKNVNAIVIGSLAMMNIVSFWMLFTMAEFGAEAFTSPIFLMALSAIFTAIVVSWRFNQTHFTHRLSVECYEPDKELGMSHFCIAVDCDVPPHKQLAWLNMPEVFGAAVAAHQEVLNEHLLDLRSTVGMKNAQIDRILQDRQHEVVLEANRAPVMNGKTDIWGSPVVVALGAGCILLAAALIWFMMGG